MTIGNMKKKIGDDINPNRSFFSFPTTNKGKLFFYKIIFKPYLMKNSTLIALVFLLLATGCKKERSINEDGTNQEEEEEILIDPSDVNTFAEAIDIEGSETVTGTFPSSTTTGNPPTIVNNQPEISATNGSQAVIEFDFTINDGNLKAYYFQIVGGLDWYRKITYPEITNSGTATIEISIPTTALDGDFCVKYLAQDTEDQYSNELTTCINVVRVGTGTMHITVSWNTPTDQDLYVYEPDGNVISFANPVSPSGGMLDQDATSGGTESIFYLDSVPVGDYSIGIHDYSVSTGVNTCQVSIHTSGGSGHRTVYTTNGNEESGGLVRKLLNGDFVIID